MEEPLAASRLGREGSDAGSDASQENPTVQARLGDPLQAHCVRFCSETRGMMLLVRDRGRGFDPTQIPDPTAGDNIYKAHGSGIFLIRVMMDQVRYRRGGRDVVMRKRGRGVGFKKTAKSSSARRPPS